MKTILGKKDILIKNAQIITAGKSSRKDIYIKNGKIDKIGSNIKAAEGFPEIKADGYTVFPGFIDMHVHLRDPGEEKKEDIKSGIKSALRGGITSIACMPNTKPPLDSTSLIKYVLGEANKYGLKIYPIAAMTKKLQGSTISEIGLLKKAGAAGFSDDGNCVTDCRLMFEIMKYAKSFDSILILHEEEYTFSKNGLANEGFPSIDLGLEGISRLAEETLIARDLYLSKISGARIHITHVSSKGSLEMVRKAKKEGIKVTCDVTPHHLYFNDTYLKDFNTNFKVNPPIRSSEDQKAIIAAIKDGTIDAIASDHAPHLMEDKNTTFKRASFGAIGMETLFKATFTKLCKEEGMDLREYIKLITINPAEILRIKAGSIEEGKNANLAVVDTGYKEKLRGPFYSKSSNCPFIGEELFGEVVFTINNGDVSFVNSDLYE